MFQFIKNLNGLKNGYKNNWMNRYVIKQVYLDINGIILVVDLGVHCKIL